MTEKEARNGEHEAATALVTIGAVLRWEEIEGAHDVDLAPVSVTLIARLRTGEKLHDYLIGFVPEPVSQTDVKVFYYDYTLPGQKLVTPAYWYRSVREAKAACEIPVMTGQFPPGEKPELFRVEQAGKEGPNL